VRQLPSLLRLTGAVALCASIISALSMEAPAATEPSQASVTAGTLQAKIKEVEATTDLEDQTRTKLVELYRKTLTYLEQVSSSDAAAKDFRGATESATRQAEAVRKQLEQEASAVTLDVSETAPLPEIKQVLLEERANLAAVADKLADLEKQLASEAERPAAVRKRLTEAKQLQEEAASKVKRPSPADESAALSEARRWMLEAQALALSAEVRMLDQELLSQPVRVELLRAKRDEAALSAERIGERVKRLEELVLERRRADMEQVVGEAEAVKREVAGKHPLLENLAEQNAALSEVIASVTADLEGVTAAEDQANKEAKRIGEEFQRVKQKLEVAGLSQALGMVLFEQRRSLPNVRVLRKQMRAREQEIAVGGLRQIRHQEERRHLSNTAEYVDGLTADLRAGEAEQIREELRAVARKRKALLDQAVVLDQTYFRALGDLDFAQRQLLDAVQAYDEYLAGRLLWIRSTSAPSLAELRAIPAGVALLISRASWLKVTEIVPARLSRSPAFILLLVLFGALLWKRPSLLRALHATGQHVGRPATDRFAFTLQALLLSLLLAAPWPLLAATFGWLLRRAPEATAFSDAVSIGLLWVPVPFFYMRALRILCVPNGLAASHFLWPEVVRRSLRRELGRLMALFLPAGFVALVLVNHEHVRVEGGLERLAIAALAISLAIFFYGLLEPGRGALRPVLARDPTSVIYRLRPLWLALALAVPAVLVGLDVYGYLYTAGTLVLCLARTVGLVFALVVAHQLAVRWLTVVQRRLAYKAIRERLEAARAAEQAREDSEPGSEAAPSRAEEPEVDLATLSEETRKLLNSLLGIAAIIGLWLVWWRVVPAFGFLDEIALWHRTATVAGEEQLVPITLRDGCLAVVIGIITVAATRRFPALLQIVLRHRLEMTVGGLYTATTLSRYLIVATGTVLAFNAIGFSWSQIQWLVAALGVGIGFGLQEIVANFISGLIILFERPIRVGDVVTVGDADGVVTRIQIRATTIRTWDRKELIVPNKEFVTGRLLNWSLSDPVTRIVVPVGIAYGSDVQRAMALMVEAAEENERVLEDPKPFVSFDGFGDNALSLTLRCYVGSLDHRLATVSELNQEINRRFNAAGIVIAFPQRDVHLDASRPLDIRIRHDDVVSGQGTAPE